MPSGKYTLSRDSQLANALSFIDLTPVLMVIFFNDSQFENASESISKFPLGLLGKFISFKFLQ